jgi:ABC-type transport system involved in Fe-S cluster assembly fused permease/ATPase subunit
MSKKGEGANKVWSTESWERVRWRVENVLRWEFVIYFGVSDITVAKYHHSSAQNNSLTYLNLLSWVSTV